MFDQVFVEKDIAGHARTKSILAKVCGRKNISVTAIEAVDSVFNRVKKPYLQKRDNLNLFIGTKKGALVKEAPNAYGEQGHPHYYFVHAYNCIYECQYCYLQGYFSSPDLVFFINHEDIAGEIETIVRQTPTHMTPWFHAGEFSDSLALAHLTDEIPFYFDLFARLPGAKLEFRTKSVNIRPIRNLSPLKNVIFSFSLSGEKIASRIDEKVPSPRLRLRAMGELARLGHPVAAHFDPIVYHPDYLVEYDKLLHEMKHSVGFDSIEYLSLGVVRFSKESYLQAIKNYPDSILKNQEFVVASDQKMRYPRPVRLAILRAIKELCLKHGVPESKIYFCMED